MPSKMEDVAEINEVVGRYKDQHFSAVLAGFCAIYLL